MTTAVRNSTLKTNHLVHREKFDDLQVCCQMEGTEEHPTIGVRNQKTISRTNTEVKTSMVS
jgi:hypothetical protein